MRLPAVAVVGVGYMGAFHAEKFAALAREGVVRMAGVHDRRPERMSEIARPLGVPELADLGEVARSADAACVAVSTAAHAEVAEKLLRAGLHVLVEKPIASTRAEACALIEAARQGGRVLQVGHVERFSLALQKIRPIITRPRFIEVHRIGPYPGRATDVSVVLDLMIHDLDIVAELVGTDVERIEAIGVPVLSATEDIANARVRFANGCILNLTASRVSFERMRKIRIFQANAYISIDLGSDRITVVRREGGLGADPNARIHAEELALDKGDALLAQDRSFAETVASGGTPVVTGEDGLRALDLALRIQESIPPLEELA